MANQDHVEWLAGGHLIWNERRKLIAFSPDLSDLNFPELLESLPGRTNVSHFRAFDFTDSDLSGAILRGLDFSRARFQRANLEGADLSSGRFERARFTSANLADVNADGASFLGANLVSANLAGANLSGARLDEANTKGAELSDKQLADALPVAPPSQRHDRLIGDAGGASSAEASEQEIREHAYLVMYATNREPLRTAKNLSFGGGRASELSYGSCEVEVPQSHKVGSLGSPFIKRLFRLVDDRLKLKRHIPLNAELHWQLVDNVFSRERASPPTVLVHGYNTSFENAVLWAAQIGFDLGLRSGVSLFSWPARGGAEDYLTDEATVESSKYYLAKYLADYARTVQGPAINLIAHSMGCRCLVGALEQIGMTNPELLSSFNHVILAAADVDQDAMSHMATHVVGNAGRTTSYVCDGDLALSASKWLHTFPRVGLLPPIFLLADVDTIEVEKVDLVSLGHGYVSGARSVLTDMFELIRHSSHPEERFGLQPVVTDIGSHWRLVE